MEDADSLRDLPSIPRGKKRDRIEAGSVFGGDESVIDEEEGKPRRHTRRRTVSHKKTSVSSRGQKRGREVVDSPDSQVWLSNDKLERPVFTAIYQDTYDIEMIVPDDTDNVQHCLCNTKRMQAKF